ncbi:MULTISPECIES: non-ribosomal peptide synthetase [Methylosinus]|uniref:Non-ribosomal peptide synthetase n=1 Tax=Methylosinus trichosporium (strain ATCC 35070 / NCIMB 11131 / UNIQEM 75 / OB3b) TaxID=595536 RepID=A0A2D2D7U4_METT3|nr:MULTISPECIES: non-ribosomal peptide synthetase [Methylosinus]ATQ70919.1 non-ribosomal peptide synthetase [Methylosinus trichosporium OB3b]OBS50431.1 non-ribosomal peptide synthetase [Methylosinus sp. 3S-1]
MTTRPASHGSAFDDPANFVECLQRLAATRPEDEALTVVVERNGEVVETTSTYRAFVLRVQALAAVLQRRFETGDRVMILLDNDENYAVGLFACFHAGVIAVPVFPPESTRPQHLARLAGIAADARARGVLTASALLAQVGAAAGHFGALELVVVDEVDPAGAGDWRPREPAAADIAFLQYTSGSTSAPKGVMVTHDNLMANERAIREGLSIGADDKLGVWSPLFHDMGLIGGLLQPFYSGIPCVLSSPRFFLERPLRWLEMISRHRVTISGGPDFAYRLCLDRIKETQLERLDLSCWRVAYTGAEPVRPDTMEAFVERFASAGFRADAVHPCYGLAEATLYVTGGGRGAGISVNRFDGEALAMRRVATNVDGVALVGCGASPSRHEIRIVEPQTGESAEEGAIGEIWAAGPSIAAGYWNKPRESAEAFVERDGVRWLRTGDLGFLHDSQLFVAGRLKDMIIVRGHNIYPQDVERAVETEVEAVRKGRVTAFAVAMDGQEGVGVAAEVSLGLQKLVPAQALVDAVSAAVSEQCGEAPKVVVLLNPGALPKTSSGKLQRAACRNGWAERSLDAYALFEGGRFVFGDGRTGSGPATGERASGDETHALAEIWREALGHESTRRYAEDAHFFTLGGSSLAAARLAARVSQKWDIDFTVRHVFERPRLQEQAEGVRACQSAGARTTRIPVLPPERRGEPSPLSPAQQRQWFLWRLDPQSTAYHIQCVLRIAGALDVDVMREAVAELGRRHDSLRCVFRARTDGEAEQIVRADVSLDLKLIDLRDVAKDRREARAAETLRELDAQRFDLTCGPLARAALVRLDDQAYVLALVTHHIVSDGASMQILVDDLAALYAARVAGASPPQSPALHYTDYAAWRREHPDVEAHERQLAFWRERLDVAPGEAQPVLALQTDHPRPTVARYAAGHHRFELPADVLIGLRRQAESRGATLFMALLAAFQALLHRYTGQNDIRVGVPVANRGRPELRSVVGLFVNTLVLRTVVDGRMSFSHVLEEVREAAIGAQANQDLPFEQLVEALQPERSLSHSPLFQVMFNHLQADYGEFAYRTGLAVEGQLLSEQAAQFELTLDTREHSDGRVSAHLTYARELFEPSRIERLAGHYLALLRTLSDRPELALGEIVIQNAEELRRLAQLGENRERYPSAEPVHRLIERRAAQQPDATALILGAATMSYGELDRRANRLAHRLIALDVGPERRVGLAVERSIDMIVGLLAVLKAGGAFVPLDPRYPAKRLADMMEDSRIELVLTQIHVRERLGVGPAKTVLAVDELDLRTEPDHAPSMTLHGKALAYVIYTSGSTGRAKGVAVAHHALAEHARLSAAFSSLVPDDRMLQFATLSFDGFIEQLFPPLLVGASVVLRGPELWSPDEFLHELRERRISIVDLPTAYWLTLIQSFARADRKDYGSLREVHIGGEAMPSEAAPIWREAGLCDVKLLNTYGPTEAVVVASLLDCAPFIAGERAPPLHMPIGRPLPGRSLRVLDADLQPAPLGVAGELCIGGPLLARGYLDRPGLTAERFVADPFDAAGGRLYRTGDRVRWNVDGDLEYLGRLDQQVKIRGFRVEPGEIEAKLLAQPEVREAVVVAKDARLLAYVSPQAGQAIDVIELRARLASMLPDYLTPGSIMLLESLPLGPNGKLDRRALPAPERPSQLAFEAPQGEVEEVLARLWAETLGIERVGRRDNFFELGGHSLLLLKLHQRLDGQGFAVAPSVIDFFRYPTIESLAAFLSGRAAAGDSRQMIAERAARQRQAFLPRRPSAERTRT